STWEENKKVDGLSKMVSTSFAHLSKQVLVEELKEKSIDEKEVLAVVEEEGHTWMTSIHEYLVEEIIPEENKKAWLCVVKQGEHLDNDPPDTPMKDKEELRDLWILFTDGSSCTYGSEAGLIITNPEGMEFTYALKFRFNATNNEAEYEALIAGVWIAKQMGVKNLQENVDTRLVANQVNKNYVAKKPSMIKYLEKVKNLASTFKEFSIKQVPGRRTKK
nr:reverse transcriptase domain-containing protein [Tanacetum cinerariifolium]